MFDELAHIRESGARWTEKKTNSASPVLLFRCLNSWAGAVRRVDFAFDITSETVGEKNLLKPLRETAQAISNDWDLLSGTTWARSHNALDKCQTLTFPSLDQSSRDALSGTLCFSAKE